MQSRKVLSEKKLKVIKAVLNVDYEPDHDTDGSQHGAAHHRQVSQTFDEVMSTVMRACAPGHDASASGRLAGGPADMGSCHSVSGTQPS